MAMFYKNTNFTYNIVIDDVNYEIEVVRKNQKGLYLKYKELADKDNKVIFGGRLGQYKYYDMHKVIEEALNCVKKELN